MGHVKSPCVNTCQLDSDNICLGCLRTIEEIANWTKYTDKEKSNIINCLPERKEYYDSKKNSS